MQPPSFQLKAEYNTSRASSQHFVRYIEHITHANDCTFYLDSVRYQKQLLVLLELGQNGYSYSIP